VSTEIYCRFTINRSNCDCSRTWNLKSFECSHVGRRLHPHYLHSICLPSLTSLSKSFTKEHVRCTAVSVVPHEGVCESLVVWLQVVHPPQLHTVLLAVAVVIWLAVNMVMLRPAGEPVCRENGECVRWLPKSATVLHFFFGKKCRYLLHDRKKVPVLILWHKEVTGIHTVTEKCASNTSLTQKSYSYTQCDRRKASVLNPRQKKVPVLTLWQKKVPVLIPWHKKVTATHNVTEKSDGTEP